MSNIFFIGDLHFGHTNIHKFRPFVTETEHRQFLMETWQDTINKRDIVYVMGDAAFTQEGLDDIHKLSGKKILIRGNHDLLPTEAYLNVFEEVYGIIQYKGMWLSHAPIHHSELYGRTNVHGHCHRGGPTTVHLAGQRHMHATEGTPATYFNTCAEHLPTPYVPIKLDYMQQLIKERINNGTPT
jgi:calcineurin-like phosphoesterase family protein